MKCRHCQTEWNMPPGRSLSSQNCPFCGKPLAEPVPRKLDTMEAVLSAILDTHGREALQDSRLVLGCFRDLAPKRKRDLRILRYFTECQGPKTLFEALNGADTDQRICLERVARMMIDDLVVDQTASYTVCQVYWKVLSGQTLEVGSQQSQSAPSTPVPDHGPDPEGTILVPDPQAHGQPDLDQVQLLSDLQDLLRVAASGTTTGQVGSSGIVPGAVTTLADYQIDGETLVKYKGIDKKIQLPAQIKIVGEGAFDGCKTVEEIVIPPGVHTIGSYAFEGCKKLKIIHIPTSVTEIDMGAFSGCEALEEISIPGTVKRIWGMTFSGCTALKKATLLPGVEAISSIAFSGCSSLAEIALPDSLTTIADNAFNKCNRIHVVPSGAWKDPKEQRFQSVSHLYY